MSTFLNTTTHTVSWFIKRNQAEELELKAPFQRNPVWTPKQKAFLIDTILRGYPIPELYMQEFTDSAGKERYVVVDGQQRLRACIEFVQGEFQLDPEDSPDFANMDFEALSPEYRQAFYNYKFVIRTLPDMPELGLREMFTRLNRNVVALNPQELRHATYWGDFIQAAEKVADDERWSLIGIFSPNDVRRMLDIEFISEVLVAYLHGVQNKKDSLDDWYQTYERGFERKEEVIRVFDVVLAELLSTIPDLERTRWRKKSDFYSLFLVLAKHHALFPLSREGRRTLRDVLADFGKNVDRMLSSKGEWVTMDEDVLAYVAGVERAASDIAKRKERGDVLENRLATVFSEELKSRATEEGDGDEARLNLH